MAAPPLRTDISDTYPNPSNATARAGLGALWDYVTGLLGMSGDTDDARVALGFPVITASESGQILVVKADGAGFELRSCVGQIVFVPGTTPPAGAIKANGALLPRADFPALWAYAQASGNMAASDGVRQNFQFSPGDGSTTFRAPDVRGRFPRFWDDGKGVDSGRGIGTDQADQNKAHTHAVNGFQPTGSFTQTATTVALAAGGSIGTTSEGGTEARPVNGALLGCIYFE